MVKEKERFSFEKLELPTKGKDFTHPIKPFLDTIPKEIKENNSEDSTSNTISTQKVVILSVFSTILLSLIAFGVFKWLNKTENSKVVAQTTIPVATPIKTDSSVNEMPPKYINYHDSIVFLNDVKGEKRVVSKGFDEYLKKNKIIIKSGKNYFNCFCNDLFENYKVGDIIP